VKLKNKDIKPLRERLLEDARMTLQAFKFASELLNA
jgi:hypothetical protein